MNDNFQKAWDGSSWCTNIFLKIYDWFALGFTCPFIWGCKAENIIRLYNQHMTGNHLDIGIGTGYFLDKCVFPVKKPEITIIDINPFALKMAKKRLARYNPGGYVRDVLKPLDIGNVLFDSIGLAHLFHCLPGDMKSKGIVFHNLKKLLKPGGVIFGSTFLTGGTSQNIVTKIMFWLTNRIGFMHNKQDNLEAFSRLLKYHFPVYSIHTLGSEILFWARTDEKE